MNLEGLTEGKHFNATEINKNMGERLVMHMLMTYWNWDVEIVDYIGADLIAIDNASREKYAISVKTRDLSRESQTNSHFKERDYKYLCEFSSDMSKVFRDEMIPLIAFVMLTKSGHMLLLLINAYDFNDMNKENKIVKNYHFNVGDESIKQLFEDERVSYLDMEIKKPIEKRKLNRKANSIGSGLEQQNWKRQMGSFGEHYFAMKASANGLRAFVVNSIGADIILVDPKNEYKGYAVSVKTFTKEERDSYSFEQKNVNHLLQFAEKWNLVPIVALQFMICKNTNDSEYCSSEYYKMYSFTMSLKRMQQLDFAIFSPIFSQDDEYNELGIRFSWNYSDALDILKNDPEVRFEEVAFNDPIIIYDKELLKNTEINSSDDKN